jgi:hypothetical protein
MAASAGGRGWGSDRGSSAGVGGDRGQRHEGLTTTSRTPAASRVLDEVGREGRPPLASSLTSGSACFSIGVASEDGERMTSGVLWSDGRGRAGGQESGRRLVAAVPPYFPVNLPADKIQLNIQVRRSRLLALRLLRFLAPAWPSSKPGLTALDGPRGPIFGAPPRLGPSLLALYCFGPCPAAAFAASR